MIGGIAFFSLSDPNYNHRRIRIKMRFFAISAPGGKKKDFLSPIDAGGKRERETKQKGFVNRL